MNYKSLKEIKNQSKLKLQKMIKQFGMSQLLRLFKNQQLMKKCNPAFLFSIHKNPIKTPKPTMKEYEAIKNRQKSSASQQHQIITQSPEQQQKSSESSAHSHSNYRCDGCNTFLQFKDKKKYGFINEKVFNEVIDQNTNLIKSTYGQRVASGDSKVLDFLHEIQKQSNIEIFTKSQPGKQTEIKNLDNISVLLTLQQKIDRYEEQNQTLKRSKKIRKQVLCYRCHSLKYHNHLPEEYDSEIYEGGLNLDRQIVLQKVFNKHKSYQNETHYLFVVDGMDLFGTLRKDLVHKLLEKGIPFSVVINKCDIINQKYIVEALVHQQVKKLLKQHLREYQKEIAQQTQYHNFSSEEKLKQIKVFFVSSVSRQGVKKIEEFMNEGIKRIQLFGVPNTGKTSLLNKLLNSSKLTSSVPGTTIRVSQFVYRQKIKVFDMPGLHYPDLLYNLVHKPSLKSILTWNKSYAPPLMTHHCFIYGGKIQANEMRIVPFGLGGCCSSDNRWFIMNYKEFWKGLPDLNQLNIVRHEHTLVFKDGKSQDLQIAGYGFISFKPCIKTQRNFEKRIIFYLPQNGYHSQIRQHFPQQNCFQEKASTSQNPKGFQCTTMMQLQKERKYETKDTCLGKVREKKPQKDLNRILLKI